MLPGLGRNTQKLDAVVDGKFPDDLYSASIFSKLIGNKLSDGIRRKFHPIAQVEVIAVTVGEFVTN